MEEYGGQLKLSASDQQQSKAELIELLLDESKIEEFEKEFNILLSEISKASTIATNRQEFFISFFLGSVLTFFNTELTEKTGVINIFFKILEEKKGLKLIFEIKKEEKRQLVFRTIVVDSPKILSNDQYYSNDEIIETARAIENGHSYSVSGKLLCIYEQIDNKGDKLILKLVEAGIMEKSEVKKLQAGEKTLEKAFQEIDVKRSSLPVNESSAFRKVLKYRNYGFENSLEKLSEHDEVYKVEQGISEILEAIGDIYVKNRNIQQKLIPGKVHMETEQHGFVYGALILNFKHRYYLDCYIERSLGRGTVDFLLISYKSSIGRDQNSNLNAIPITIELKAGEQTSRDAVRQAEKQEYLHLTPSIKTIACQGIVVGVNLGKSIKHEEQFNNYAIFHKLIDRLLIELNKATRNQVENSKDIEQLKNTIVIELKSIYFEFYSPNINTKLEKFVTELLNKFSNFIDNQTKDKLKGELQDIIKKRLENIHYEPATIEIRRRDIFYPKGFITELLNSVDNFTANQIDNNNEIREKLKGDLNEELKHLYYALSNENFQSNYLSMLILGQILANSEINKYVFLYSGDDVSVGKKIATFLLSKDNNLWIVLNIISDGKVKLDKSINFNMLENVGLNNCIQININKNQLKDEPYYLVEDADGNIRKYTSFKKYREYRGKFELIKSIRLLEYKGSKLQIKEEKYIKNNLEEVLFPLKQLIFQELTEKITSKKGKTNNNLYAVMQGLFMGSQAAEQENKIIRIFANLKISRLGTLSLVVSTLNNYESSKGEIKYTKFQATYKQLREDEIVTIELQSTGEREFRQYLTSLTDQRKTKEIIITLNELILSDQYKLIKEVKIETANLSHSSNSEYQHLENNIKKEGEKFIEAVKNCNDEIEELKCFMNNEEWNSIIEYKDYESFLIAVYLNYINVVNNILDNTGNNVLDMLKSNNYAVIRMAVFRGHKRMASILLGKVQNKIKAINAENSNGMTSLHIASIYNRLEIIGLLLENIKEIGNEMLYKIVNAFDEENRIPMLYAAYNGYEEVIRLLFQSVKHLTTVDKERYYCTNFVNNFCIRREEDFLYDFAIWAGGNSCKLTNKYILECLDGKQKYKLNELIDKLVLDNFWVNTLAEIVSWAVQNGHTKAVDALLKGIKCYGLEHEQLIKIFTYKEGISLFSAIQEGHKEIVMLLLNYIKDFNFTAEQIITIFSVDRPLDPGYTPLHNAINIGQTETAIGLLNGVRNLGLDKEQVMKIINISDKRGMTPLHLAASDGYTNIVKVLLKSGAIYNSKNEQNKIPIELARDDGLLLVQINSLLNLIDELFNIADEVNQNQVSLSNFTNNLLQGRNLDDVEAIVNACNTIPSTLLDTLTDTKKAELLVHAIENNYDMDIINALLESITDINQRKSIINDNNPNRDGKTSLHIAVQCGNLEVVKILLNNGASVDTIDRHRKISLHYAVENDYKDVVEILLQRGANVNAQDIYCVTPLYLARTKGKGEIVQLLLQKKRNNRNGSTFTIEKRNNKNSSTFTTERSKH